MASLWKDQDSFLTWIDTAIQADYEKLYCGGIPDRLLTGDERIEKITKYSNEMKRPKEQISNIKRLDDIRRNLSLDLEYFGKLISKVMDEKILEDINVLHDYHKLEPHHYFRILCTIEEITFFTKSNLMEYDELFTIRNSLYQPKILTLKDNADTIRYHLPQEEELKIRLPINPKVTISNLLTSLWLIDVNDAIIRHIFDYIIEYFTGTERKLIPKEYYGRFHDSFAENYKLKDADLMVDKMYFYSPPMKLSYSNKS